MARLVLSDENHTTGSDGILIKTRRSILRGIDTGSEDELEVCPNRFLHRRINRETAEPGGWVSRRERVRWRPCDTIGLGQSCNTPLLVETNLVLSTHARADKLVTIVHGSTVIEMAVNQPVSR